MFFWLLILATLFAYLAVDAWRLQVPSERMPYEIEAKIRGELGTVVPLHEQQHRRLWMRLFGVGSTNLIFWLWLFLAIGCLAGAGTEVLA